MPVANFHGGVGSPRPTGQYKNYRAVGAGYAPPATVYYNEYNGMVCRGGINAARCSRTDNAIYRASRTGRIYASPTNLPEMGDFAVGANSHGGAIKKLSRGRGGACPARNRIL